MKDDGFVPDAVITVRGASFGAGFAEHGVSRLVLPPLADMSQGRERGPIVRIVDREKPGVDERAGDLARFLEEYLAGGETGSVPAVDLGAAGPFTRSVLEEVRRIPRGSTASYGRVALAVGRPGAARAVGGAVSRNPVPLLVPCHRVVRSDGSGGGWSGAEGWKEWLLDMEGEAAWR
ncbi:MAG: methylated-DNA--[protein]-cysteine S-methyltransferase [Actinomycetota bacterium]